MLIRVNTESHGFSKPLHRVQIYSEPSHLLAAPTVSLLDWYHRLWNCYILDSALKIRLEEEQGQLQRSIARLTAECDILLQCCNDQDLGLFGRRKAVAALNDGIVEALKASEKCAYRMIELN
jgi:hypothetical protein